MSVTNISTADLCICGMLKNGVGRVIARANNPRCPEHGHKAALAVGDIVRDADGNPRGRVLSLDDAGNVWVDMGDPRSREPVAPPPPVEGTACGTCGTRAVVARRCGFCGSRG